MTTKHCRSNDIIIMILILKKNVPYVLTRLINLRSLGITN